jgi:hypothetical protein
MPAIITDKFRILNASNFVDSINSSSNSYYIFVGLSNPTTSGFGRDPEWNTTPPNPTDNIDYLNHYKSTILFGKKLTSASIRRVIRRIDWVSGQSYDMYRHDYSGINSAPTTGALRLYDANYYVVNSDYRIYICVDNGSSGSKRIGNASQIEPNFTDLEPVNLEDGYTWKYLYTLNPSDIVKFDSTDYITIPNDWNTSTNSQIQAVRENGDSTLNDNQIKQVYIENNGNGYTAGTFSCDIVGDGSGASASVTVGLDTKISDVIVTSGGKNYTYALVNLGTSSEKNNSADYAELIPIIPPSKGHGYDIYEELGADKLLVYTRFDDSTKDFPVDTKFAQVGIIKNPTIYDSTGISTTLYTQTDFSATYAMILDKDTINGESTLAIGDRIQQEVDGGIAYGYVVSYDKETKVLKYNKDRALYYDGGINGSSHKDFVGISSFFSPTTNSTLDFENSSNLVTNGGSFSANILDYNDSTITISNKIINLGVQFISGLAKPEINNKSGEIIYINNRSLVNRNSRQKEDIKIILEF